MIAASCWMQVADSPFASITQLVDDLGSEFPLPSSVAKTAQAALLALVKRRTGVDFAEASPMKHMVATRGSVLLGR